MANKIQKNDYGVNVLVESVLTPDSKHMSHLDRTVGDIKILTKEELLQIYDTIVAEDEKLEVVKNYLKKRDGYATSNVYKKDVINYGDIVVYNERD